MQSCVLLCALVSVGVLLQSKLCFTEVHRWFVFSIYWEAFLPTHPSTPSCLIQRISVYILALNLRAAISIMMSDGVVSIGDGKPGNESSPTNKRRASNTGAANASTAPVPASRAKRSPQGSVAGESSTKGSERDEMEEVSNEEGQWV